MIQLTDSGPDTSTIPWLLTMGTREIGLSLERNLEGKLGRGGQQFGDMILMRSMCYRRSLAFLVRWRCSSWSCTGYSNSTNDD